MLVAHRSKRFVYLKYDIKTYNNLVLCVIGINKVPLYIFKLAPGLQTGGRAQIFKRLCALMWTPQGLFT